MAHVELYRLKDGARRYRARWQGPDGRDRSRTFPLKRDADRFVLEWHRQAALGGLYQAPTQPLGEFLDGWLVRYERRVRQSSADRVRDVLPHLGPFRRTTLDALRPAEVEDHISALSARAPRQAELALRVLKQVLSDAKVRGLTVNDALFRIRAPNHEPREMRFLSWARSTSSRPIPSSPTATWCGRPLSPACARASCSRCATATSISAHGR